MKKSKLLCLSSMIVGFAKAQDLKTKNVPANVQTALKKNILKPLKLAGK